MFMAMGVEMSDVNSHGCISMPRSKKESTRIQGLQGRNVDLAISVK